MDRYFKIGDYAKCINTNNYNLTCGKLYKVIKIDCDGDLMVKNDISDTTHYIRSSFTRVTKRNFKMSKNLRLGLSVLSEKIEVVSINKKENRSIINKSKWGFKYG